MYGDDAIEVRRLLFGSDFVTAVWLSDSAQKTFTKFVKTDAKGGFFAKKLKEWAKAGFKNFEGAEDSPIKHEEKGVFRIGVKASLFRLYGFYGEGFGKEFIVIDASLKKGQRRNSRDTDRVDYVARTKRTGAWRKVRP